MDVSQQVRDRFWAKVDQRGPTECWDWAASVNPRYGYGQFQVKRPNGKWAPIQASRMAYFLTTGELPRAVRHTCDRPPCCNPAHLVGGSMAENSADMVARDRGRGAPRPGERNPMAYLTIREVRQIRALAATGIITQREIAMRYGTSLDNVKAIVQRRTWKHVD